MMRIDQPRRFAAAVMIVVWAMGGFGVAAKEGTFEPVRLMIEAPGVGKDGLLLNGAETRGQVLVTATDASGAIRDFTSTARFEVSPAGIVRVEKNGLLIPVADGEATLQ